MKSYGEWDLRPQKSYRCNATIYRDDILRAATKGEALDLWENMLAHAHKDFIVTGVDEVRDDNRREVRQD
jgi:hypothetical protein